MQRYLQVRARVPWLQMFEKLLKSEGKRTIFRNVLYNLPLTIASRLLMNTGSLLNSINACRLKSILDHDRCYLTKTIHESRVPAFCFLTSQILLNIGASAFRCSNRTSGLAGSKATR